MWYFFWTCSCVTGSKDNTCRIWRWDRQGNFESVQYYGANGLRFIICVPSDGSQALDIFTVCLHHSPPGVFTGKDWICYKGSLWQESICASNTGENTVWFCQIIIVIYRIYLFCLMSVQIPEFHNLFWINL